MNIVPTRFLHVISKLAVTKHHCQSSVFSHHNAKNPVRSTLELGIAFHNEDCSMLNCNCVNRQGNYFSSCRRQHEQEAIKNIQHVLWNLHYRVSQISRWVFSRWVDGRTNGNRTSHTWICSFSLLFLCFLLPNISYLFLFCDILDFSFLHSSVAFFQSSIFLLCDPLLSPFQHLAFCAFVAFFFSNTLVDTSSIFLFLPWSFFLVFVALFGIWCLGIAFSVLLTTW